MRVYIDTSVIGGCLDEEFEEPSRQLFLEFRSGKHIPVISELTLDELAGAPSSVIDVLSETEDCAELITLNADVRALAARYIAEDVIGPANRTDALHIAAASVHRVDVLTSWNFKHIVNLSRIRGYNSVNMKLGYPMLEIRTPQEVVTI